MDSFSVRYLVVVAIRGRDLVRAHRLRLCHTPIPEALTRHDTASLIVTRDVAAPL